MAEKDWTKGICDWGGRDWAAAGKSAPHGSDARHNFVPLKPPQDDGATRYCNRCNRRDSTPICRESVRIPGMNFAHYSTCGRPAKMFEGGKGYCGVHDPVKKRAKAVEQSEKWEAEWAAKRREWARTAKRIDVVAAAIEWRKWHSTDAPCEGDCEHMDCALARRVDEFNAI